MFEIKVFRSNLLLSDFRSVLFEASNDKILYTCSENKFFFSFQIHFLLNVFSFSLQNRICTYFLIIITLLLLLLWKQFLYFICEDLFWVMWGLQTTFVTLKISDLQIIVLIKVPNSESRSSAIRIRYLDPK